MRPMRKIAEAAVLTVRVMSADGSLVKPVVGGPPRFSPGTVQKLSLY